VRSGNHGYSDVSCPASRAMNAVRSPHRRRVPGEDEVPMRNSKGATIYYCSALRKKRSG
jgi:hypothetical protein